MSSGHIMYSNFYHIFISLPTIRSDCRRQQHNLLCRRPSFPVGWLPFSAKHADYKVQKGHRKSSRLSKMVLNVKQTRHAAISGKGLGLNGKEEVLDWTELKNVLKYRCITNKSWSVKKSILRLQLNIQKLEWERQIFKMFVDGAIKTWSSFICLNHRHVRLWYDIF